MKSAPVDAILRPGPIDWELWVVGQQGAMSLQADVGNLSRFRNLLLAVPTRDILAVPLWVGLEGDLEDIVELEMASRHLLARNARLNHLSVLINGTRRLVMAMGVVDGDRTDDAVRNAQEFECPARMFHPGDAGMVLWREFSQVCIAFYSSGECVHFTYTGETSLTASLCETLSRTAARLRWEEVLSAMPARAVFLGAFSDDEAKVLCEVFHIDWSREVSMPPPVLPALRAAPLSPNAALRLQQRAIRRKVLRFGFLGAAVYAFFLLAIVVDLLVGILRSRELERSVGGIETAAIEARNRLDVWKNARPAVDPTLFAIDQLAAVAARIPGDRVRLTEYEFNKGKLFIAGEAADVSESYEFFEQVRNDPRLQDYDWTSRQPKLSGRNKVRFEMEGTRYDAEAGK
jgi:hypothetical protein